MWCTDQCDLNDNRRNSNCGFSRLIDYFILVYDSSAKLPSGLLNGNVNQLGDFDMCLSAQSDDGPVKGQYCLASLEVQIPNSPYLAGLHKLIQSHYHFKSKLEDVCSDK